MMSQVPDSDPWILWSVLVASGANVLMGCLSFCFLIAPDASEEGTRIVVKTFANSSLKFGTNCSICLADLEDGQLVGQLGCGHAFHEPCIRQWLALRDCCPLRCRDYAIAPGWTVFGTAT
eukprot:CAMPEP_0179088860 /NCGR_PEP_ID=MMETSP0796-20121207/40456_1 /TAXON_ID=73915 /ORGANISM="Pyrodinium bahamense, Strain pbaha01" /LENGTH=119 /DNA_ID=CAMNT_0020786401 /DNA_START=300 /DNA_END=655 /DNA_ORIENTATION=-